MKTKVLVTGGSGQLGQAINSIAFRYLTIDFLFVNKNNLDITDSHRVLEFFKVNQIDWCINCAAYTNVDKAETEPEQAFQINVLGARNIAQACQEYSVKLIHISTDFVFDGLKTSPYTELDETNPINVYGESKLKGENEIKQILEQHFIIRTSWLYSEHGNNFMKTMLRLAKERDKLSIINDQFGTPTYAGDLAHVLLKIIKLKSHDYGVYHYSNDGHTTWYDFAKAIFQENNTDIQIISIKAIDYPTSAKRPGYSVLDNSKIIKIFNFESYDWKESLIRAVLQLYN